MIRTFAVSSDGLLYDPASGVKRPVEGLPVGRYELDDTDLPVLPRTAPANPWHKAAPTSLCWSPLVRCNLSCPHCLDDTSVPEAGADQRARIAGILARAGLAGVDITGGEPLLLRDLPALARRVTASGRTAVAVTTNGWHLQRRARELVGTVDAVRVSLDGADAESNDRLRGSGSFERALAGIAAARALNLPVQLQMVLMASNCFRAQDMVDLAARLGARGVSFLQFIPYGAGAQIAQREALTDEQAFAIVERLDVPASLRVRVRSRESADKFTVVRADGRVWRSVRGLSICSLRPLNAPDDLSYAHDDDTALAADGAR